MNTNVNNIKNGYTMKLLKFILSSIATAVFFKSANNFRAVYAAYYPIEIKEINYERAV
jgi:hypothetical protein